MRLGLGAFVLGVIATTAACSGGGGSTPTATTEAGSPTAEAQTSVTVVASATPASSASPTSTPSTEPRISGLFNEPRVTTPTQQRSLGAMPASAFAPWNRIDVVLYDIAKKQEQDLGPGAYATFSPDGKLLAWVAGAAGESPDQFDELRVIEVATGQQRSLGPARTVRWTDNDHILVYLPPRSNDQELVEVSTGKRLPPTGLNPNPTPPPTQSAGYRLEAVGGGEAPSWTFTYRLSDLTGARGPVEFDGLHAVLTADGTVILGTPAVPTPNPTVIQDTTSNLFAIDPVTRTATYLATVALTLPNWPLAANARYVAWTDDYCKYGRTGPLGHTRIYDRTTKTITELDQSLWVSAITSDDRLGVGEFGPDALLDLKTLSYAAVVPGGDQAWSPDFKYAAVGSSFGHGGYCGA